jgi:hypothetical protein
MWMRPIDAPIYRNVPPTKNSILQKEIVMQPQNYDLESLARRVQEGDFAAMAKLTQELEPSLVRIVRRVLEKGTATTSLERKILVAAQRLCPQARPSPNDPRTAPLAHNLCLMIVNRLCPGRTETSPQSTLTA